MAIAQATFDALVDRVLALETSVGNTVTPPLVNTVLRDINTLQLNTISRSTIAGLITEIEKVSFQATKKANAAEVAVIDLSLLVNAFKESLITLLDGLRINESVTGDIDGVNRDFVTRDPVTIAAVPYIAGSLIVAIDNKIYYGTTYITETDPATGKFELLITPGASQVVKVIMYKQLGV